MPFVLNDEIVNRPVFGEVMRTNGVTAAVNASRSRKFSRSRLSPAHRVERYVQTLLRELKQDSGVNLRITQIEAKVRTQTLYTSKAKARRGIKSTENSSDRVKQILGA